MTCRTVRLVLVMSVLIASATALAPHATFAFSPPDAGSGALRVWLDAGTVGLSDGASVATWSDQSGQGNNATQGVSGAQPVLKLTGLNGHPTLRFDGGDELTESPSVSTTDYTVFLVASTSASAGTFHVALGYGDGTDGTLWMGMFNSTGEITISGSSLANDLKSATTQNTSHIYEAVVGGGTLHGYIDGSSIGTGAIQARASNYLTIGSYISNSLNWTGDISEIIIYNNALNDTDRQQVESYLNTKYSSTTQTQTQSRHHAPVVIYSKTQTAVTFDARQSAVSGSVTFVTPSLAKVSSGTPMLFTKNLSEGMTDSEVLELQRYLNSHGYTLAANGHGAAGQETTYFGSLTKKALIRYQTANGIAPSSGYFGAITRALVNGKK